LLLDAGNALWSTQDLALETQSKVMIDAMNLLSYDAMALGDQDLELGVDVLRQRIADSKFPVLSANVTLAKTKELLAKPYVLKQVAGHGVAIIGVTGNLRQEVATDIRDAYVVLKADDVLAKYVAEVQSKADVIIVLSTLGYDEDMRLSSAVPGIDVILGGVSRMPMQDGWRNERTGTLIYQAGSQGEWIGRRVLHLDSAGVVTNNKDELILLTEDYADDPEMRGFLDSYTQK